MEGQPIRRHRAGGLGRRRSGFRRGESPVRLDGDGSTRLGQRRSKADKRLLWRASLGAARRVVGGLRELTGKGTSVVT